MTLQFLIFKRGSIIIYCPRLTSAPNLAITCLRRVSFLPGRTPRIKMAENGAFSCREIKRATKSIRCGCTRCSQRLAKLLTLLYPKHPGMVKRSTHNPSSPGSSFRPDRPFIGFPSGRDWLPPRIQFPNHPRKLLSVNKGNRF